MSAIRSLVLAALVVVPACGGGDGVDVVVVEDDPVDQTINDGLSRGSALADAAFDDLAGNDYTVQIGQAATIMASINDGVLLESDFAAQVVIDGAVFDMANVEIIDHEDANAELDAVVRFYGSGYYPSNTADAIAGNASTNLGALRGAGSDVDFRYVEIEVVNHASASVLLGELYAIIGPGEMGDFILNMQDMVDAHLADAANLLDSFYF